MRTSILVLMVMAVCSGQMCAPSGGQAGGTSNSIPTGPGSGTDIPSNGDAGPPANPTENPPPSPSGKVARPVIAPENWVDEGVGDVHFTPPLEVTITCATPGAQIYYVLNVSEDMLNDDTSAALYSGPLHLDESTTVHAYAIANGMERSGWAYADYRINPWVYSAQVLDSWELDAVWGTDPRNVLAAGYAKRNGLWYLVVFRYDGMNWSQMWGDFPGDPVLVRGRCGLWGSGPNDVYCAFSGYGLYHYDGTGWSWVNTIFNDGIRFPTAIWGASSDRVFVVGDGFARYDGQTWQSLYYNRTQSFSGVWGSDSQNVFAVGSSGTIIHYDGSTVRTMDSGTSKSLKSIWGAAAADVFAGGTDGLILHYDGVQWSTMASPSTHTIGGLWGSAGNDVYAVVEDGGECPILHYNGVSWSPVLVRHYGEVDCAVRFTPEGFYSIWGSGSSDVVAVGYGGNCVRYVGSGSGGSIPPTTRMPSISSFSINNGASETESQTVALNNVCTGNPTHYMASESPSFTGASWQTYSTSPSFTLSSGDGTKTVYFKVKNDTGVSDPASDSIILSEPPPMGWSALRTDSSAGLDGYVYSLMVYNGELIAGGTFRTAGWASNLNRIVRWNGSNWLPLSSGMDMWVYSLAVYNGKLIAGGVFHAAGGVNANYIAQWDSTSWASVGSGINSTVDTLISYNEELIAGGRFEVAGGVSANRIAKWNGNAWSPMGGGMNQAVGDLTVYDDELIAGGWFDVAGGVSANRIAKWNGKTWSPLGAGLMNGGVSALIVYNGELIAGGTFTTAGGASANRIAKWDGTKWSPLGGGMDVPAGTGVDEGVYALAVYNGRLIAGGSFTTAGGKSASRIAQWDGTMWSPLGSGVDDIVHALTIYDGELIAGGKFRHAGGVFASYIAKWNGR